MRSGAQTVVDTPIPANDHELQLLIEPEPWLRIFLRNLADLFRTQPATIWITARPAEYWPDALVNRPIAWGALRQSGLTHVLGFLVLYVLHLAWLTQPTVAPGPQVASVLHYELSEYLPAVNTDAKPDPPRRRRPQKADPEYAPQEIVVLNDKHKSTRQTIVQPSPVFLKQDIPLPNLVASTVVPGAPSATRHPLPVLPMNAPQIAPPAQPLAQSNLRPLLFPPPARPEIAAPSEKIASRHTMQSLPLESAVVIPPAPDAVARKADSLRISLQSPPQVAPPVESAASRPLQSLPLPLDAPQVPPPAPATAGRNLSNIGLPLQQATAVPPSQPLATGNTVREKEMGQMLVLNARPVEPIGPLTVPDGNRAGEFTASPTGHAGATAQPEIKEGNSTSPANIYVAAPPAKVTGNVIASTAVLPASHALMPDHSDQPRDHIDNQIFGARQNYSMRLNMPNLTSSTGSWSIKFAELNSAGHDDSGLSAPEAIKKVDPAYPQDLMHDRVEGTVVLYAVIHADGSVGDVRVLEGVDERLNENARKALAQWKFRPGTKDGVPVDVEAVVRVPFKVRRSEF